MCVHPSVCLSITWSSHRLVDRSVQGDFFQVGESIKTSNFNYEILGWIKVILWLQTTWHLLFRKEKIFLANFVSIVIKTKISWKSRFFLLLFMWMKLKLQNPSEKLFLNRNKSLDINISDTNKQIFNFLTKISHFCA